ncbi:MAG: hypothetical protein WAN50_03810 [Minisyncoccia bacterium]
MYIGSTAELFGPTNPASAGWEKQTLHIDEISGEKKYKVLFVGFSNRVAVFDAEGRFLSPAMVKLAVAA